MTKHKKHISHDGFRGDAEKKLVAIIDSVFGDSRGPILIAIGGPGGTGKSTLSNSLVRALPDASLLSLDDYKTAREFRKGKNIYGPHPEANELALIRRHLECIKQGENFDKPLYCSDAGEARDTEPFRPARFNIVDGEISTYKEFRDLVDFSVFVDSDWKTQLKTRISRDVEKRKYSTEKAIATFLHSNLREFAEYGADSKRWADLHIYCHDDYRLEIESIAEEHYYHLGPALAGQMVPLDLSGLIVPPPTPFNDTMGIDEKAFVEHLEFLADHGVTRILVNGTTAEFFSLLPEERKLLLTVARRYFPGIVLFNTASDSLLQAKKAARWAEDYGADAIVAMAPYYYASAPAEGLIEFFNELGDSVDIPMMLYNFTKHTNNPLTPEILKAVKHIGIKDSSGDYSLIDATSNYFAGTSRAMVEAHLKGAKGFVSALANHMPKLYVRLEEALKEREMEHAGVLQAEIAKSCAGIEAENEIAFIKTKLSESIRGYPLRMRLPLR